METNARLSTRRIKLTVTPKFISSNGNMAFTKLRQTQSLTCPTTRTAFLNFLITPFRLHTHNLSTSLAAQTQTTFSILQIKTILKNKFWLSASYFFILLLFLTTSPRQKHITKTITKTQHFPSLANNNNKTKAKVSW